MFKADLGGWLPNNGRWYSYALSDGACASGVGFPINPISPAACFQWLTSPSGAVGEWVSSIGPWWIDPNHKMTPGGNGFGFINVLAFTQLPAALHSPANLHDTVVTFSARVDASFSTVPADSLAGHRQGHVYLWFQTSPKAISPCTPDPQIGEDCTRQSNYILTGGWDPEYEIDRIRPGWTKDFNFTLKASETDRWTCLGHGVNVKYDCIGIEQALRTVAVIGFVIAPTASCPTVVGDGAQELCDSQRIAQSPKDYLNMGQFDVRSFAIRKSGARATNATRIAFRTGQPGVSAAPEGWLFPQYAKATRFASGTGLHVPIESAFGAVRIGLASSVGGYRLDEAGYQLYLSPAGADPGQTENVLWIVSRNASGRFDDIFSASTFRTGDSVGFYFDEDALLFLKNDEVIFQVPSPCGDSDACKLYPFVSSLGARGGVPRVFVY